jgi:glycosyltransferase involved in cell wall biosynthesis
MNLCLVTAFPPSQQALNEYGFHVARELRQIDGVQLTILGDELPMPQPELDGFYVMRCWSFNRSGNIFNVLKAIREVKPDVVWFNLGFASFGDKPMPAFMGIMTPALSRLAGFDTHVTLHQLMETVDLKDAQVRFPALYRAAGFAATQVLLCANSVSLLLPAYRKIVRDKYHRGTVFVRRHGALSGRPEYPDFKKRGNPDHRILAFGKWGTYKRLELMIEAFRKVCQEIAPCELIIAGTDHPKAPGYMKSVEQGCGNHARIRFIGYVPEGEISNLLQSTSVAVLPYSSSAGSSGIAHLASAYGVPIIASDIPDTRQLVTEEGLAIEFYEPGNVESLAETITSLLANTERLTEMALQNASAALRMSMPEIIRQYIRSFEMQRRVDTLIRLSRARSIPAWVPFRSWYARRSTRNLLRRSATAGDGE